MRKPATGLAEFAELQAILGDDAPKTFAEFQDLKYNRSKEWDYTKRFAEYIRKYPNSDKRYFDIQEQLRAVKGKGGVVLPPVQKQAFILPTGTYDPYHIINRMMDRGITDDELRSYIRDAKIMVVQWGGRRQLFIGKKGMCLIVKDGNDWKFRTAWKAHDCDESSDYITEAIKNAGL